MTPTLEFAHVWKSYGAGLIVLRAFSFALSRGEIALLVGENGAGKTTAFDIASGDREADSGQVRIHGRRLDGCSAQAVAALGVRRMHQTPTAFSTLSICDNVLIGKRPDLYGRFIPWTYHRKRQEIWEEVRAQASALFSLCPFLDSCETKAGGLSFGQQRILDFLRAYSGCSNSSVLLLDEPFAGIHSDVADEMWQMVRNLTSTGVTVLVIEHEDAESRFNGVRRLRLAGGRLQ